MLKLKLFNIIIKKLKIELNNYLKSLNSIIEKRNDGYKLSSTVRAVVTLPINFEGYSACSLLESFSA